MNTGANRSPPIATFTKVKNHQTNCERSVACNFVLTLKKVRPWRCGCLPLIPQAKQIPSAGCSGLLIFSLFPFLRRFASAYPCVRFVLHLRVFLILSVSSLPPFRWSSLLFLCSPCHRVSVLECGVSRFVFFVLCSSLSWK